VNAIKVELTSIYYNKPYIKFKICEFIHPFQPKKSLILQFILTKQKKTFPFLAITKFNFWFRIVTNPFFTYLLVGFFVTPHLTAPQKIRFIQNLCGTSVHVDVLMRINVLLASNGNYQHSEVPQAKDEMFTKITGQSLMER